MTPVMTVREVGTHPIAGVVGCGRGYFMLGWALIFMVIAIIAAIFGFGGIAGTATSIAVILFWIFLAIFIITLIVGMFRGRGP